jgi:hypothetical protein
MKHIIGYYMRVTSILIEYGLHYWSSAVDMWQGSIGVKERRKTTSIPQQQQQPFLILYITRGISS